jgi:hypothetical protein
MDILKGKNPGLLANQKGQKKANSLQRFWIFLRGKIL